MSTETERKHSIEALTSGAMATSAGGADILVARMSETLIGVWARAIGNVSDQEASAVAVDPGSGAPVVGGQFAGTINFGVGPDVSTLTPQAYILKLAP